MTVDLRWFLAPMAACGLVVALPRHPVDVARAGGPCVLDVRQADFLEDAPESSAARRVVASLEATLLGEGEGATLRITASALGPRVAPPRGVVGVRGGNDVTAREIALLATSSRIDVRVRDPGGPVHAGRVSPGRQGVVLGRRLGRGGVVEHVPLDVPGVLEIVLHAPLTGPGVSEVVVRVDGVPRLRATCRVGMGRSRILSLEGLYAHGGEEGQP